jgi:hypothetical protein
MLPRRYTGRIEPGGGNQLARPATKTTNLVTAIILNQDLFFNYESRESHKLVNDYC